MIFNLKYRKEKQLASLFQFYGGVCFLLVNIHWVCRQMLEDHESILNAKKQIKKQNKTKPLLDCGF